MADFGLAVVIDESTARNTTCRGEGTTRWMAPELLYPELFGFTDKQLPTKSTDIYAFGMTILEVRTLLHPSETQRHLPIGYNGVSSIQQHR